MENVVPSCTEGIHVTYSGRLNFHTSRITPQ